MKLLDDAIKYAVDKHSGMVRKRSNTPYIMHPLEAAVIISTMTDDPEVIAAAVLHDTVEDTDATPEDIRERFGERVAELVASETETKYRALPPELTWRSRKEESLQKLTSTDDLDVKRIWLADKLSNMRSFFRLYLREGSGLWRNFHQSDPVLQEWYYRRIADLLSDLKDTDAWQEYSFLVNQIFGEGE